MSKGDYSEKRSKFLAFAHHVETEEEVKDILQTYRKKYFDARHVCYAYALSSTGDHFRTNDDGEPSGTAGRPILGQIRSAGLTDILIVIVRYYGGINLGTGGLIVAYKAAAAEALKAAVIEERIVQEKLIVTAPYEDVDLVLRRLKEEQAEVTHRAYDAQHTILTIAVRQSRKAALTANLQKIHTLSIKA